MRVFRRADAAEQPNDRPVIPSPVVYAAPPERVRLTLYYSAAVNRAWIRTVHINGNTAPAPQADYPEDNAAPGDSFRRFRH